MEYISVGQVAEKWGVTKDNITSILSSRNQKNRVAVGIWRAAREDREKVRHHSWATEKYTNRNL